MVAKYRDRNAFRVISNWRIRMACGSPNLTNFSYLNLDPIIQIVDPSVNLITKVVEYDEKVAGMNRESWCRNWVLSHKAGKSFIAIANLPGSNEVLVKGYGQIHEISGNRLRIGPLYAEDESVARALIAKLVSHYPDIHDREVRLSLVADDLRTEQIVLELGLDISQDYFELRMHTQYEVPFDKDRMFLFSDSDVNLV